MKVVTQYLTAIVSQKEYDEGVGHEYPNLYIVTDSFTYLKRSKLAAGGHCLLQVKELPKPKEDDPNVEEKVEFLPGGKVPFSYLNQILSFFKKVMEVNFGGSTYKAGQDCEAMAHILWNKVESKYEIGIPIQRVSKASVSYEFNHIDQEKHIVIVDIHSHNTMGAFFSGVDDSDDKKGCWFAGVAGHLDRDVCQVKFRFTNFGIFKDMKLEDIFEPDPVTGNSLIYGDVDPAWMEKVQGNYTGSRTPQHAGRGTNTGGQQREFDYSGINNRLSALYAGYDDEGFDWWNMGPDGTFHREGNWQDDLQAARNRASRGNRYPATFKRHQKKDVQRVDPAADFYGRAVQDAVEAIEDLDYPMCKKHIMQVAKALLERVTTGINNLQGHDGRFIIELIEHFAEEFSEINQSDLSGYEIPFIVSCLQMHSDYDGLCSIFSELMNFMESTYEDNAHIDLILGYLEENESLFSVEQVNRLRSLIDDVQIQH